MWVQGWRLSKLPLCMSFLLEEGVTAVSTTLPDDALVLSRGESVDLRADRDFSVESDKRLSVLQPLPGGEARGIPNALPGGDPSLIVVGHRLGVRRILRLRRKSGRAARPLR